MTSDRKTTDIQKNKNAYIELCRFLFCTMIVLHHCQIEDNGLTILPSGFQAVEFFFFLSGFFAMRHVCKESGEIPRKMRYAVDYTLQKLKRVFPYTSVGILICYAWRAFCAKDTPLEMVRGLMNLPFELFYLPMTGIMSLKPDSFFNSPLWYLSALLLTLPLVIYLALKVSDVFCSYLVWFVPPLIHGWLILEFGGVGGWDRALLFGYCGIIRAFGDLLLGCGIYLAAKWLAGKETGKAGRLFLTIAEIALLIGCLALSRPLPDPYNAELAFFMLAVSLTITMSGKSYSGLMRGGFWIWLGHLSLPVYCVHWGVMQMVQTLAAGLSYPARAVLIFGISIAVSAVVLLAVETGRKILRRRMIRAGN